MNALITFDNGNVIEVRGASSVEELAAIAITYAKGLDTHVRQIAITGR